jgi:poly-gamma-glutamate capsule biosynthesis protein CapA/YwtB (metallophosphatase superfamily)
MAAAVACLTAVEPAAGPSQVTESPSPLVGQPPGPDAALTLFLAGDAIITQTWSMDSDPAFLALVDEIRGADLAIINLELVLHTYKGYAQADSGGSWLGARPEIAAELAWAGVDMVATANNHSFDWGSTGILETLESVTRAGLVPAGTGKDLQSARAPAYRRHPDGTVALVSTASTFTPYGQASPSRPDVHGRPGLNPLTADAGFLTRTLWRTAARAGVPPERLDGSWLELLGLRVSPKAEDLEGNLAAVKEAAASADLAVFSIHAHRQGLWLTELAHRTIDAGADVFFAQGPHRMMGVEIYRGKPIFYGLGNFVYQPEQTELFPAEVYEQYRLNPTAAPEDVRQAMTTADNSSWKRREPWEAVAAIVRFEAGEVTEVRLLPMDLRRDAPPPLRGRPCAASPMLGRQIIARFRELSRPFGVGVQYLEEENAGTVVLD